MKVYFRVDASAQMGLGHLMRCLALAQEVFEREGEPVFFIQQSTLKYCQTRHDWVGRIVIIPESISGSDEINWISDYLIRDNGSLLILDGYQFSTEYKQQLKMATGAHLIVFDDNNDLGMLHADLVINGSHFASNLNYQESAPHASLCVGPEYRVLRTEFSIAPTIEWSQRMGLLITIGGSDPTHSTLPLLQALEHIGFDAPIRIITGAGFEQGAELEKYLSSSALMVQHLHNFQSMADALSRCRLAICAAGGTQYEAEAMATPSLLLVVADNQLRATHAAVESGWCQSLDVRSSNFEDIAQRTVSLWQDEGQLLEMHQSAQESGQRFGAANVVDKMIALLN
jgi:UDP-2,4-diacetamido-2,4,6-trideoxy-beta-L-altropyranose hydrolase